MRYEMEQETFTTHNHMPKKKQRTRKNLWKIFALCMVLLLVVILGLAIIYGRNKDKKHEEENARRKRFEQGVWLNMRLPNNIIPTEYFLRLNVNMDKDTYKGYETIKLQIKNDTKFILFHKVSLNISFVYLRQENSLKSEKIIHQFSYERNEYYVLEVLNLLKAGKSYRLTIIFDGMLRSELSGFYKSTYTAGKNTHKVASTFFSPISARKAFPCFDEPKFKANFTLHLTHSSKYESLSNMPSVTKVYRNDSVTTYFKPTLKMSTYILCWVISNFESIKTTSASGLSIKAWASPQNIQDTRYGLTTTSRVLTFFENYFKIPYPLTKLDIVAVPNFSAGAMENWGLITYRSSRLLYNKEKNSESEKQSIFHIIAHELVHQWFGNLATMKFWTDAWLKEGFANYISIYGGEKIEPSMELMKQSLPNLMLPALDLDSYSTSHPISTSATTPDEIREIFDVITYQKGHCMVQMLHEYLGNDFQKGLQRYLTTYSYKNADQNDLWEELSLVSGKDVKPIMDTWTLQLGFPVVTVERINSTHVEVQQERFTLDPPNKVAPPSPFNYTWHVPLAYKRISSSITSTYLLTEKKATIEIPEHSILNPKHAIFYRLNYKGSMLKDIKDTLLHNHTALSVQDKVGLISDQFSMTAANISPLYHALDMTKYIKNESDFFPWKETLNQLTTIYSLMSEETIIKSQVKHYIRNLTEEMITPNSWNKTTDVNKGLLQVKLLNVGCAMDVESVVQQAKYFYREWMKSDGKSMPVEANLYRTVRSCAISHGTEKEWDFAYKKYEEGGSGKASILASLTSTRNEMVIQRLLNYTNNNTRINSQDATDVISHIAINSALGRKLAWSHVKNHWSAIFRKYNNELFLFGNMLTSVLSQFSTTADLMDIENFLNQQTNLGSGKKAIDQSLDKIKSNIMWKKANSQSLKAWLYSNN